MATKRLNEKFTLELLSGSPLDLAVDFISDNMEPEEVFSDEQLEKWAERNGFCAICDTSNKKEQ